MGFDPMTTGSIPVALTIFIWFLQDS